MKKNNFIVKRIEAWQTRSLRHTVLWPHIEKVEDCNIDIDQREDGIHLGAFDGERIVSIASFFEMRSDKIEHGKQYRLRAMATDPEYRRTGAGKRIIEEGINQLREREVDVLWCNARKVALNFYLKLGFDVIDEWYDIPLIGPHKFMYYPINR